MREPGVSCAASSLTSFAGARRANETRATTASSGRTSMRCVSILDVRRRRLAVVGPAVVGDRRRPAGAAGVLVVRVRTEPPVQLGVLPELLAVELHAKARPARHLDRAV